MREDIHLNLEILNKEMKDLDAFVDEDSLKKKIEDIKKKMASPQFWQEDNREYIQELKKTKSILGPYLEIKKEFQDIKEIFQIVDEEQYDEISREIEKLRSHIKELKLKLLLNGEYDFCNAILSINAGAGGVDACDWAGMLLRMYTRWAESKGYEVKILDSLYFEEAGIKNATIYIKGTYAYGYLKSEKGVHRLVRISPFDANRRRHTSFASVDVIPEVEKDLKIDIKDEDLKIETFRSSGPGGQHVNVTDSAVRITHIPTGIVVQCRNERSQYQNKQTALKILKARLFELEREKLRSKIESLSAGKMRIEWGSQIRSYVLHPYTLIKDHRTNKEISWVERVLDGDIDPLIEAYLLKYRDD